MYDQQGWEGSKKRDANMHNQIHQISIIYEGFSKICHGKKNKYYMFGFIRVVRVFRVFLRLFRIGTVFFMSEIEKAFIL